MNVKQFLSLAFFLIASFSIGSSVLAQADNGRVPELPVGCEHLAASADEIVAFSAYATGVQIYSWNGTAWRFVSPRATLYADAGFHGKVVDHFGGPTWKSNSGSRVVGKNPVPCTPDPDSIPWLGLEVAESVGPGIFDGITFIQRLETVGGKAPSQPGTFVGEPAEVPYTATYVFYRTPGPKN